MRKENTHKEYYTIQMDGVPIGRLSEMLREVMEISEAGLTASRLNSSQSGEQAYTDALDLNAFFSAEKSAGTISVKHVKLHRAFTEAVSVIAHDSPYTVMLDTDIPDRQMKERELPELGAWLTGLYEAGLLQKAIVTGTFTNDTLLAVPEGAQP